MREVMQRISFEPTQFIHHAVDLLGIRSLGVENGLGVVDDYEHLLGRKGRVVGVSDPRGFRPPHR
jgi:hypothetical protein